MEMGLGARLRRMARRSTIAALAFGCLAAPSAGAIDDASAPAPSSYIPGEVIVRFEPGTSPARRADVRDEVGAQAIEGLGLGGLQLARVTDGDSVAEAVDELEANPVVRYAQPNFVHQPMSIPNDPGFSLEWALQNTGAGILGASAVAGADIDAPPAWDIETGEPATIVAVMDTGADLQHLDLAPNLWGGQGFIDGVHGYDFIDDDTDPSDLHGHGTHTSGTILARGDNGVGITGVSQRGQLMELRVCGPYDEGCAIADEIAAIDFAGDHGARVVNGSLGGPGFSPATYDTIQANPNILFVFSAGNGADDGIGDNNDTTSTDSDTETPIYPCSFDLPNIICVAATNQSDQRAGFSNYGLNSVDLGAPGTEILSTSAFREFSFEDFESSFDWVNTGTGDWVTTAEAPLTSTGITDSPGGNYTTDTTYVATSDPFMIPPGYSTCELDYFRSVQLADSGDVFKIEAFLTDSPSTVASATFTGPLSTSRNGSFSLVLGFDPGVSMQLRLTLTTDGAGVDDGVHMDDISLVCFGSPSASGYEYLQGTSMSAPQVSGTAALMFSAKPGASVSEVKAALLGSVDPLPSLAGKTVSGGRLNARRALEHLLSISPKLTVAPEQPSVTTEAFVEADTVAPETSFAALPAKLIRTLTMWAWARFQFRASEGNASFLCRVDRGRFRSCPALFARWFRVGRHAVRVKARDAAGNVDPTPAVFRFRVKRIL